MSDDIYHREWNPRDYLRQYYSTETLAEDDRANAAYLCRWLFESGRRFNRALEFGCGPTIHHAAFLGPYVDELHLADYLPENLEHVREWLDDKPDAHDWDAQLNGILDAEKAIRGASDTLENRKAALRRLVTELKTGDARRAHPLGDDSTYDLVASFYTIECVDTDKEAWARNMRNVCSLVSPGGVFTCATLRRANYYHIFERELPATFVDENDYAQILPTLGFDPTRIRGHGVPVAEWTEQGFKGICVVWAEKE